MKALHSIYIKKEVLETLLSVLNKKQGKEASGVELTISTGNDPNKYEQTVSGWVSQTKEQREAKKERFFVGNGKTFWSESTQNAPTAAPADDRGVNSDLDDLPF